MFKKKALIACYIYSFDYSGDPLRLDDLMFRVVPVKGIGENILCLVL